MDLNYAWAKQLIIVISISLFAVSVRANYGADGIALYLYTVYDKLFANSSEKTAKSTDIQPVSDSEFMRLIVGKDWTSLLAILDELMDTIKILQPRLYDAVMRKLSE